MSDLNKKRKVDFENRAFQNSWTNDFLFVPSVSGGRPVCLLCNENVAVAKVSNLKRHFETKHSMFDEQFPPNTDIRRDKVKSLQSNLTRAQLVLTRSMTHQERATEASLRVSWTLTKSKKPFSDAEIVKECMLEVIDAIFDDKEKTTLISAIKSIPLSDTTAGRRVDILGESSFDILCSTLKTADKYSLAVDESTDKSDVAQLAVYVRFLSNNIFVEELLCLLPMMGHTGAKDVYEKITDFLAQHQISLKKMVSLTTDGAPAMIGKVNGLAKRLTDNNPSLTTIHCIIHQSVLCAQLSGELTNTMSVVMKLVNFIRSTSSLQQRLFKAFLTEIEAEYDDLLVHNDVRWLSKGRVLQRLWSLKEEVKQFLSSVKLPKAAVFKENLDDLKFMRNVAFLCDIFGYLNELNTKLQGRRHNVADLYYNITAFRKKLILFEQDLSKRKLLHFPTLAMAAEMDPNAVDISVMVHFIQNLIVNFEDRFQNFQFDNHLLVFLTNPFVIDNEGCIAHAATAKYNWIDESTFQLQLIDLQSNEDLKVKLEVQQVDLEAFWITLAVNYPVVRELALTLLTVLASTYVCESSFSVMNIIKNKQRMRLEDKRLEHCLRIATTSFTPDFKKLGHDKKCNFSH